MSRKRKPPATEPVGPLLAAITESLDLLGRNGTRPRPELPGPPLPSLLEQAQAMLTRIEAAQLEPIRTIHQFACTGGTLISRCLAALPSVFLVSELDPLSRLGVNPRSPRFAPSDLILHLHYSIRPVDDEDILAVFLPALKALLGLCDKRGQRLVLRDHAHSKYCSGSGIRERPSLDDIVRRLRPVQSLVTVRQPMESYMSLLRNGWEHFTPRGIDAYCERYLAFLDDHAHLPMIRYEDFVADPAGRLADMAAILGLPFDAGAVDLFGIIPMTGDSGRRGSLITPRPARPAPPGLAAAAAASASYARLCSRLGY